MCRLFVFRSLVDPSASGILATLRGRMWRLAARSSWSRRLERDQLSRPAVATALPRLRSRARRRRTPRQGKTGVHRPGGRWSARGQNSSIEQFAASGRGLTEADQIAPARQGVVDQIKQLNPPSDPTLDQFLEGDVRPGLGRPEDRPRRPARRGHRSSRPSSDDAKTEAETAAASYGFKECGQPIHVLGHQHQQLEQLELAPASSSGGVVTPSAPAPHPASGDQAARTGSGTSGSRAGSGTSRLRHGAPAGNSGGVGWLRAPPRRQSRRGRRGQAATSARPVQLCVPRRRPRSARRACPAPRSARSRAPRSGPRAGWSRAGARSRSPCGPRSSRSRPASIVRSVRTSTFEVASSRIRIRGSASSARAKAIELALARRELRLRARRPPVSNPPGSAAMKSRRRRSRRPPPRSPRRSRPGRPKAMLSRTVPGEQEPSCGTIPSWRRSAARAQIRAGRAVDQHPPLAAGRRSARPASANVDLPAPGRADQRQGLPVGTWIGRPRRPRAVSSRRPVSARPFSRRSSSP